MDKKDIKIAVDANTAAINFFQSVARLYEDPENPDLVAQSNALFATLKEVPGALEVIVTYHLEIVAGVCKASNVSIKEYFDNLQFQVMAFADMLFE